MLCLRRSFTDMACLDARTACTVLCPSPIKDEWSPEDSRHATTVRKIPLVIHHIGNNKTFPLVQSCFSPTALSPLTTIPLFVVLPTTLMDHRILYTKSNRLIGFGSSFGFRFSPSHHIIPGAFAFSKISPLLNYSVSSIFAIVSRMYT